ncbi:hypothetical protein BC832DRAFT_540883 [Gaertneriomyces semiglobifer]|nr:hypothetical protein BC832DRAFT_540883 [Gaertneriomyces semiglobifer]
MPRPLKIRPVPVPVTSQHPPIPVDAEVLPRHEFTAGLIAPKGSGKTTLICNLLDFYSGYFHTITIFSPTINSDDKWKTVRRKPLLAENIALKKWLENKGQTDNPVVGRKTVIELATNFDPKILEDHFLTQYNEATLATMMEQQLEVIETLKGMGGSKHLSNCWWIIFDNLVGSSLFNNRRDNAFKKLNTTHRHHSASLIFVTQAYQKIPLRRFLLVRSLWFRETDLLLFPHWIDLPVDPLTHFPFNFLILHIKTYKNVREHILPDNNKSRIDGMW